MNIGHPGAYIYKYLILHTFDWYDFQISIEYLDIW